MKKLIILASIIQLLSACSPVDSVRTMDQQQTARLVKNMYPSATKMTNTK